MNYAQVVAVFDGSDGDATRALYGKLVGMGPPGIIAMNLFRACKNSGRAKVYKGGIRGMGSYKAMAYDRKDWSLGQLCAALRDHSAAHGLVWGWKVDEKCDNTDPYRHVLYVDLPTGQVSFHSTPHANCPVYPGEWDKQVGQTAPRICYWIADLFAGVASVRREPAIDTTSIPQHQQTMEL